MTSPSDGGGATSPSEGVAAAALGVLGLSDDDQDAARLAVLAQVSVDLVTGYLDRPQPYVDGQWPAPVLEAATTVTLELHKRKDAPFGITGAWSPDGGSMRIARDTLAGVHSLLDPYRSVRGLA